jgi:hypothetical protein
MSRFVQVTKAEMDSLLHQWTPGVSGKELVYEWKIPGLNATMRVCSSVFTETKVGRGRGKDAIRIYAFDPVARRGVRRAVRVYRTPGWQDRVKSKATEMIRDIRKSNRRRS